MLCGSYEYHVNGVLSLELGTYLHLFGDSSALVSRSALSGQA